MRREMMVTVPSLLGFAAFAMHGGHMWLAVAGLAIAAVDTLTGRS